jgi:Zn-finger nucleic acid-binding protein
MLCPRTSTQLKKIKVGGIPVFISEACRGVFFNNQNLENFEQPDDKKGTALVAHLRQFHNKLMDESKRVTCPSCPDVVTLRRYYPAAAEFGWILES